MALTFLSMKKIYEVKMFDIRVQSGHIGDKKLILCGYRVVSPASHFLFHSNNCSEYWHVEGGSGDLGALYANSMGISLELQNT